MNDREREPGVWQNISVGRVLAVGASVLTAAGLVGVPLQVAIDQGNRPAEPQVTYNPLTWAATPISNWIENITSPDLPQPTTTAEYQP
ncbi:MAG TPA: hypothetical protein VLF39_03550 [Candidatus Saccharimonadales bacterium]|nr:hypothetical protein [Candidatus Saccharimonadales bacterium]